MGCGFFFFFLPLSLLDSFILFCMYESFAQVLHMCTMCMHGAPKEVQKKASVPLNSMVVSTMLVLGIERKSSASASDKLGYCSWSLTC